MIKKFRDFNKKKNIAIEKELERVCLDYKIISDNEYLVIENGYDINISSGSNAYIVKIYKDGKVVFDDLIYDDNLGDFILNKIK